MKKYSKREYQQYCQEPLIKQHYFLYQYVIHLTGSFIPDTMQRDAKYSVTLLYPEPLILHHLIILIFSYFNRKWNSKQLNVGVLSETFYLPEFPKVKYNMIKPFQFNEIFLSYLLIPLQNHTRLLSHFNKTFFKYLKIFKYFIFRLVSGQ